MEKVIGCVQCINAIKYNFTRNIRHQNHCLQSSKRTDKNIITFTALRIHVSPVTSEILEKFGTFELELRGPVEMKVQCYFKHSTVVLSVTFNCMSRLLNFQLYFRVKDP